MSVININNVGLKIGNNTILEDICFEVKQGEIFGLIGHNGAGKTSLLKIITGINLDYSGTFTLFSSDNLSCGRMKIGTVLDSTKINKKISAAQNIKRIASMFGCDDKKTTDSLLEKVGLLDCGKKKVRDFSYGMEKRLLIACALIGNPKLLILDEPFNGIDPDGMHEIRCLLQEIANEGVTVLVTSHNISELLKIATCYGVMRKGKFIGRYDASMIQKNTIRKKIIKTNDAKEVMMRIQHEYPHVFCQVDSYGIVALIEKCEENTINEIEKHYAEHFKLEQCAVTEEDFLLWKMNGF